MKISAAYILVQFRLEFFMKQAILTPIRLLLRELSDLGHMYACRSVPRLICRRTPSSHKTGRVASRHAHRQHPLIYHLCCFVSQKGHQTYDRMCPSCVKHDIPSSSKAPTQSKSRPLPHSRMYDDPFDWQSSTSDKLVGKLSKIHGYAYDLYKV